MEDYVTVTTPEKGHKVTLRNYTTGGDESAINRLIFGGMDVEPDVENPEKSKINSVDLTIEEVIVEKKIERLVQDVDGQTDGLIDRVYNMRRKDYHSVVDKIKEITKELDEDVAAQAQNTEKKIEESGSESSTADSQTDKDRK